MVFPWTCTDCGKETWVEMASLDKWPLDRLVSALGYTCKNCGMKEAISYTTASLEAAERKLTRYRPTHKKFRFHLSKLIVKQRGVNARGEALHGASKYPDMAIA